MKNSLLHSNVLLIAIALSAIGLAVWALGCLAPEYVDDWCYGYMFIGKFFDMDRPVRGIADVLISQYCHYFNFNGRSVVHTIVQLFAGILGRSLFYICNAVVFAAFVYVLTRLTTKVSALNVLFTAAVVFLLYPHFGATVLWLSGAVNYLWVSFAVCLFLMLFEYLWEKRLRVWHFAWLIPSLLVGWSHEGIAFPMALSLAIYAVVNRKTICRSAVLPLIAGFVIGAVVCSFAPSTLGRAAIGESLRIMIINKINTGVQVCLRLRAFWLLVCTLALSAVILKRDFLAWFKRLYTDNMIMWNAMLLSFGVVFIAGLIDAKTAIGVEFFAMIIWLRIVSLVENKCATLIKSACLLLGGGIFALVLFYSRISYGEYERIMAQIKDESVELIPLKDNPYPRLVESYILSPQNAISYYPGYVYKFILGKYGSGETKLLISETILNDIESGSEKIYDIRRQSDYPAYVLPIPDEMNDDELLPVFILNPIDRSSIPFYMRPFASRLERYNTVEVEANSALCETINVYGRKYLLIYRHEKIDDRVAGIELRHRCI